MIKGAKVELVPAKLDERRAVFEWCFHSETTRFHAGPPDYSDVEIPTFEEFCDDYGDYFFTGDKPNDGRGFIIRHDGEAIGFVSYCCYHLLPNKAELDIWMSREAYCGKGLGTDALISLGDYLHRAMGISELIMRPSAKNQRAVKAYNNAGFEVSNAEPSDYLLKEYIESYGDGDYGADATVTLIKARFDYEN